MNEGRKTPGQLKEIGYKRGQCRHRILEALDKNGHNLSSIARLIGCSQANVSRVVNGKGHSKVVLAKLREMGVPEKYLFDPHKKEPLEQAA